MKKIAYLQMAFAMLLIGSLFVASKFIVQSMPVFTASFLRQFLAFLTLAILVAYRKSSRPTLLKRDCSIIFIQSFVGIFAFSLLALNGLKHTDSIDANIITSMTPLSMMLIAVFLLGEKLTGRRLTALMLAILGALAINTLGSQETSSKQSVWFGNFLIVLAVMAEGVFFGFGKLLSRPIESMWLSLILTAVGSVLFLPLAIYDAMSFDFSSVPSLTWCLVVYTGVGITALGVVLMNQGMMQVSASTASVFTALMPVSGVALSVVLLHETFYWYDGLGMLLVFSAIALMMFEKKPVEQTNTALKPKKHLAR